MARPKKEPGTLSAKERVEEAFWELLVEMPYDQITIGALSRRASINHNTFYYYFKSMDAMAADIVERTVFPEVPSLLMTGLASGSIDTDALLEHEEYRRYFQRICLLAGAHSTPRIVDRLKEAALSVWMSSLNVRLDDLGKQQRFLVAFLVGGILAVLGSAIPTAIDPISKPFSTTTWRWAFPISFPPLPRTLGKRIK